MSGPELAGVVLVVVILGAWLIAGIRKGIADGKRDARRAEFWKGRKRGGEP